MAKTCDDLARCGLTESGEYELDPDGPMKGEEPIRVFCNFTTNSTVIMPDDTNEISLQNCDSGTGCASINVSYEANMKQIMSIIEHSSDCQQEIVFSCNIAPLVLDGVSYASWMYKNGDVQVVQEVTSENIECKCSNFLSFLVSKQSLSKLSYLQMMTILAWI